ncbi:MAG: hypothetical protein KF715_16205 [Candidatus Didemnitutus sp.]|nr:hypothetical protein [Candidatus Didemnitutus sp.]
MWLPGTKGTTNGSGPYPVNFFPERIATFFGGQKLLRNPPWFGEGLFRVEGDFQRENVPRARYDETAEKEIDAVLRDAWRDFQREFSHAAKRGESRGAIPLWRETWSATRCEIATNFAVCDVRRSSMALRKDAFASEADGELGRVQRRRSVAMEPAGEVGFALHREALG